MIKQEDTKYIIGIAAIVVYFLAIMIESWKMPLWIVGSLLLYMSLFDVKLLTEKIKEMDNE